MLELLFSHPPPCILFSVIIGGSTRARSVRPRRVETQITVSQVSLAFDRRGQTESSAWSRHGGEGLFGIL